MAESGVVQGVDAANLVMALRERLGPAGVVAGDDPAAHPPGWSRLGDPIAVVRPADTEQVVAAVRLCAEAGAPIVPWGGRTGLVSGGLADGAIALSTERMNRIEAVDAEDATMLVQAGCILQSVCEAAEAEGLFFPLDLGARGSATIGGNIATNAGGNRVVRFGMTRDLVLGVEAVLADGSVVSALQPLMKNNTGYDLKQLFIGSEGTLGIVTRARLRLLPRLPSRNAALLAVSDFASVGKLLRRLQAGLGGQLSAFEVMWASYYELVTTPPAHGRPIVPHGHPYYVLVEAMGGDVDGDGARFEAALVEALEAGLAADAVIAQSEADVEAMWAVRDDGEQVMRLGPRIAVDVSFPFSRIEGYVAALETMLEARWPGTRLVLFGHIGDGNIHVIVSIDEDTPERQETVIGAVLDLASAHGGSISAEHGIGLDKRDYLPLSRSPAEIAVMRAVKQALDPNDLFNPGKLLTPTKTDIR